MGLGVRTVCAQVFLVDFARAYWNTNVSGHATCYRNKRAYFTVSGVNQFGSVRVLVAEDWAKSAKHPTDTCTNGERPQCEEINVSLKQDRTIAPIRAPVDSADAFSTALFESVHRWKRDGVRGIWLQLPLSAFQLAPVCRRLGFELHHCDTEKDTLLMNKWLVDHQPNSMPRFASHTVGVAGCVVDPASEHVLLIRDRSRPELWKFPGGFSEPSEDISLTAQREVFEETGIHSEFQSVIAFRQHHEVPSSFNASDIYVVCRMRLKGTDNQTVLPTPVPCAQEVLECRWRHVEEVLAQSGPAITPMMRRLLQLLRTGMREGFHSVDMEGHVLPSIFPGRTYTMFHRPLSSASAV
ncbi:nucleoside diphosphate-linked moiety X motif 6-like isoform X2 [Paramacrobiotus metropolitanus]|uniref:nucleoside diphosphate-linked moiety X motif 6-like isoform X2 n=1 Tax=Paramacrobiotus metropolitanus TaxID=2943436 RepID=UPI002445EA89|nr:nucleoside diphosphate-linked moiety X motif 6-like isoform X2 [Paramacrobiotus metropolitanus]